MKKTLLILSFCILSSAALYAEEDTSTTTTATSAQAESSPVAASAVPSSGLGDSFMAAFGMDAAAAGDTGEGGPSAQGARARTLGPGMSSMSSAVANQVTRPFTPYSYKHSYGNKK